MTGSYKARTFDRAAIAAAAVVLLCLPAAWAHGQRPSSPPARSAPAPRTAAPRPQSQPSRPQIQARPAPQPQYRSAPQTQYRPGTQPQVRPQMNTVPRPVPGYSPPLARPVYPGPVFAPTPARPSYSPPGHLGDWLNQHRTLPVQEQERMLRSDPTFTRLPSTDQQRVVQQLHQVNQLPGEQRDRRLARAEAIERMSPQERIQVTNSARRWAAQPQDRQTIMRSAFRDLRGVPEDQRSTVLNSERYKSAFSAEERGILSDMLRAEPYQPQR